MKVAEMGEVMAALHRIQDDPKNLEKIVKDHWNCPEFEAILLRLARAVNEGILHDKTCKRFLRF